MTQKKPVEPKPSLKIETANAEKKFVKPIKEGIPEAKTECYAKDKVKSLPFF
jgi:hypothetical protein